MSLVLDRLCAEPSPICRLLAQASLPLVRFSRWAMQSPSSRPSTTSLSNSWSECRTTYGHPPNVPCVPRACRSKSLGRHKEWVNFVSAQLENRSTAVTLLVRERPSPPEFSHLRNVVRRKSTAFIDLRPMGRGLDSSG